MRALTEMLVVRPLLIAFALTFVVGCARVKPYERETLAKRAMQSSPQPGVERADQHTFDVREGTGGANGNAGGGCGCN